jgi:glutamyl-tRNA(Gln) amidotransferase subunit E
MYPDTDSPPTIISPERVTRIRANLPELPESKCARLLAAGVNQTLSKQLCASKHFDLFWTILADGEISGNRLARTLIQDTRALRRQGGMPERISDDAWRMLFGHIRAGELHWGALPTLIRLRARRPGAEWLAIAARQHVLPLPESDWLPMMESALLVKSRSKNKDARLRWLMGQLQRPPGRIPARRVAQLLSERLDNEIQS